MTKWRSLVGVIGLGLTPLSLVGLGACVGSTVAVEAPASGVSVTGDQVTLGGARALAAAELAYITAADGVGRLTRGGLIRGTFATQVRGWNAEARRLLVVGKATVDTAEKARLAASLFGIADRLNGVLGRN